MAYIAICVSIFFILSIFPATADTAQHRTMGFSESGRYFAFEEFGERSGSGYPFARVTVIDLENHSSAPITPFYVELENDAAHRIADAREHVHTKVEPLIEELGVIHPGRIVASRSATQALPYSTKFEFNRFYITGNRAYEYTLTVKSLDVAPSSKCSFDKKFELIIKSNRKGVENIYPLTPESATEIGCHIDLKLSDVILYQPPLTDQERTVVLVRMFINKEPIGEAQTYLKAISIELP